ncbi:MAG: AAA family ATPase [Patescibacteria group bacterium]
MFIKKIIIKYFRNIESISLDINRGLNVFIGENNSGKSSTIDALRICLSWGNQDKSIYIKKEDLYIDRLNPTFRSKAIEFDLFFEIENPQEKSIYYDLLCNKDSQLEPQIHYRFWFEEINERDVFKYDIWGGENKGQLIPGEIFDLFRTVYLGALRDAVRDLQLSNGNKLGCLLERLEPNKTCQIQMAKSLDNLLDTDHDWKTLRENAQRKVNEHLNKTSIEGKEIKVKLGFLSSEFRRIVGNLRARVPVFFTLGENDQNQKLFEISQNGLGDNNRIYIATVLGDLLHIKDVDSESFVALLIEEPEAHLHPQLQSILFAYFGSLSKKIQVFISSHSPTITAKTEINTIISFQNVNNKIRTFSLKNSNLDLHDKLHLHKFLDVTKAQLFFANGVILVEGISEALLLPIFAKIMGRQESNEEKYNLTKFGIEIVNIGGVSFNAFAKLFNSEDESKRLSTRCAIITDSDPPNESTQASVRAQNALALKSGFLEVQLSTKTFEHDLFQASEENKLIMKRVYKEMHRNTTLNSVEDFLNKLGQNKDKGEFSQKLLIKLEDERLNFTIPAYIEKSIKWVTHAE